MGNERDNKCDQNAREIETRHLLFELVRKDNIYAACGAALVLQQRKTSYVQLRHSCGSALNEGGGGGGGGCREQKLSHQIKKKIERLV